PSALPRHSSRLSVHRLQRPAEAGSPEKGIPGAAEEEDVTRREFLASALAAPVTASSFAGRVFPRRDSLGGGGRPGAPARPVPSPSQLAWQRDELALFLHFGVNTFTDREWGDGRESPSIFNPGKLDASQWARAAKAAGFRAMILTAKHHDGFCL